MELRKYLLPGLISVTLLSGCSLFSGEEDVVKNGSAAESGKPVYATDCLEHLGG